MRSASQDSCTTSAATDVQIRDRDAISTTGGLLPESQ
jgi:hypothetical protein